MYRENTGRWRTGVKNKCVRPQEASKEAWNGSFPIIVKGSIALPNTLVLDFWSPEL